CLPETIGFWVGLKEAYVTYHKSYVESVWWALGELHRKGLLYRGHRVCWWWPQGGTALSAAEVGWNYKTVDDPSAFVAFPLDEDPGTALLAWTTTPWTLPSNGYAAVRADFEYAVVEGWTKKLVVAKALVEPLAKKLKRELTVAATMKGADLVGKRYRPPFDTFSKSLWDMSAERKEGGQEPVYWRVDGAHLVAAGQGAGSVRGAPGVGAGELTAS